MQAMALWRLFYSIVSRAVHIAIDSLFPLSPEEEVILAMSPGQALTELPPAPVYDASVVQLPVGTSSIWAYKDPRVSRLVWCVKYKKSAHAVKLGGYALFLALNDGPAPSKNIVIVPIPVTAKRRRERGYNQCELLADEVMRLEAARLKSGELTGQKRFIVSKDLLTRERNSTAQKTKDRKGRLVGSQGIFSVREVCLARNDSLNKDISIIVIDDVITTGSTMKEAIDTLRAANFSDIRGLSLAH